MLDSAGCQWNCTPVMDETEYEGLNSMIDRQRMDT